LVREEMKIMELEIEFTPYIPTDEELDEMAERFEAEMNISNPVKLIGAQ
jgi:hypothetical protein